MIRSNRSRLTRAFTACGLVFATLTALATSAAPIGPELVIEDNDYAGPAGSDLQSALILLAAPSVKVLGFTVVTGDAWRDEEAQYLLRFLEIAGASDVPVYNGAVFPLINNKARMTAWEAAYGKIPWKGAFNEPGYGPGGFHPNDPYAITPNPAGAPKTKPHSENAISFMIRMVHEHPHQVTIVEAGPMTNLALAIRQDPEFASLAKQLVFMGAILDGNLLQITDNANFFADFNMLFDPEAAHIALTADWAKITCLGAVTMKTRVDQPLIDRIAGVGTPVAKLIAKYIEKFPLWDELAAAVVVDPSIVTKATDGYMDIEIERGVNYGLAHVWPEAYRPHAGERMVTVVTDVDSAKLRDLLVKATAFEGKAN
jgi:inosine-uridine nucleoside N-ribohydrolase